jgi:hypothetical protein
MMGLAYTWTLGISADLADPNSTLSQMATGSGMTVAGASQGSAVPHLNFARVIGMIQSKIANTSPAAIAAQQAAAKVAAGEKAVASWGIKAGRPTPRFATTAARLQSLAKKQPPTEQAQMASQLGIAPPSSSSSSSPVFGGVLAAAFAAALWFLW